MENKNEDTSAMHESGENNISHLPQLSEINSEITGTDCATNNIKSLLDNDTINNESNQPDQKEKADIIDSSQDESVDKIRSRELKSLMAAVKESNLDVNIQHKRKSTPEGSSPKHSTNTPTETSQIALKRNMRSQNPEFLAKHQKFISKVTSGIDYLSEQEVENVSKENTPSSLKRKRDSVSSAISSPVDEKKLKKTFKTELYPTKPGKDKFCWQCHREGVAMFCVTCPRSFHGRCLKTQITNIGKNWTCPECTAILRAENDMTRSPAMKRLTPEKRLQVLRYALKRMKDTGGIEPFMNPVDTKILTDYLFYVVQPMDLSKLQDNLRENMYGSTESFLADAKWILHNSIIYNSSQSKLTSIAKSIVKTCKIEMSEIETCPECYINANTQQDTWFIEVCSPPHMLVWAKLKGFPYWPAKAVNTNNGLVDVRFFGDHDKAWIPQKDVFLYCKKDPNTTKVQKQNIVESIKEVDLHIEKLTEIYGNFEHAAYRIQFNPESLLEQLKLMLPNYEPGTTVTSIKQNIKANNGNSKKIEKLPNDTLEGYGTEEDEEEAAINRSVQNNFKKMVKDSQSDEFDSDESEIPNSNSSSSKKSSPLRGNVRMRGGFTNTSGRLKVLHGADADMKEGEMAIERRDSDVSSKSSTSAVIESNGNLNNSESMEITLDKLEDTKTATPVKLKPIVQLNPREILNSKMELKISPLKCSELKTPPKLTLSIADKLMKKIAESETKTCQIEDTEVQITKIDSVKKMDKEMELVCEKSTIKNNTCKLTASKEESKSDVELKTKEDMHGSISGDKKSTKKTKKNVVEESTSGTSSSSNSLSDYESSDFHSISEYNSSDYDDEHDEVTSKDEQNSRKSRSSDKMLSNKNITVVDVSKIILGITDSEKNKPKIEICTEKETPPDKDPISITNEPEINGVHENQTKDNGPTTQNEDNATELDASLKIKVEVDSDDEYDSKNIRSSIEEFFPALELKPSVFFQKNKSHNDKSESSTSKSSNSESDRNSVDNITKTIDNVARGEGTIIHKNKKMELKVISVADINKKKANENSKPSPPASTSSAIKPGFSIRRAIIPKPIPEIKKVWKPVSEPKFTKKTIDAKDRLSLPSSSSSSQCMSTNFQHQLQNNFLTVLTSSVTQIKPKTTQASVNNIGRNTVTITPAPKTAPVSMMTVDLVENVQTEEERNAAQGLPPLKLKPVGPLIAQIEPRISSTAGPATQALNKASQKLSDYFRSIIVETLKDISPECNEAKIKELQLELEAIKHKHTEEINILRLQLANLQETHEVDKKNALTSLRNTLEQERIKAVEEAKIKQWCASCLKESEYRCCWDTSYCGYACQRAHWPEHQTKCLQGIESDPGTSSNPSSTLIPKQSPVIKPLKNTYVSAITVNKNNQQKQKFVVTKSTGQFTSTAPSLTFVQTSNGGIDVLGNTGPIALGGKLISANQLPSKIKGYIVSNSGNVSVTPGLTALSSKALVNLISQHNITSSHVNIIGTTQPTTSTTSTSSQQSNVNGNKPSTSSNNGSKKDVPEIMEIDD